MSVCRFVRLMSCVLCSTHDSRLGFEEGLCKLKADNNMGVSVSPMLSVTLMALWLDRSRIALWSEMEGEESMYS